MPEVSKIVKPGGAPVTDIEKLVSTALADLESASEIKAQLKELYIVGAKVSCATNPSNIFLLLLFLYYFRIFIR